MKEADLIEAACRLGSMRIRSTLAAREREAGFDRELFNELADAGLCRVLLPTEYGGRGLPLSRMVEVLTSLSRTGMDLPFVTSFAAHAAIAAPLIARFGRASQKAKYLPAMAAGGKIGSVCNSEESAGTDLKGLKTTAEKMDENLIRLSARKSCATNASVADLFLISAWATRDEASQPFVDVFIAEETEATRADLNPRLSGFRTGATGSVQVDQVVMDVQDRRLGPMKSGFAVFRFCFHLERLFTGAMFVGILDGILELAIESITQRKSGGKLLSEYQYLQDKVVRIYAAKEKIRALLDSVVRQADGTVETIDLDPYDAPLALIKLACIEEGLDAAMAFFEAAGHPAYLNDHLAQKLVRDFMAFKFLGGTQELQKTIIFGNLLQAFLATSGRKPAARAA